MVKISITAILLLLVVAFLCVNIPDIIYPFIIAFVLAYLINPLVIYLKNKFHLSRTLTSVIVAVSLLFLMVAAIVYFVPLIYSQISLLMHQIPKYEAYITHNLVPVIVEKVSNIDPQISTRLKVIVDQGINSMLLVVKDGAHNVWSYTLATIHILLFMILVPVVLFFFLRDWDHMSEGFFGLFPKYHQQFVRKLFDDIDNVLVSYLRGEVIVCSILVTYYSIGLTLIGIDFSVLLGIVCGFAIILPLIGSIISISALLCVGYFTFGISIHLVYVAILYGCGAIVETSVLSPKIIGDSLGVNPAWIIFSVLLFGYIAGPIAMLLAVPTTGIIKVILKHLQQDYKRSELYNSKA